MLLSGWVVLTAVERWGERAPWPSAVLSGLLWSCVVAGVWWFAEWTQSPLRTARQARAEEEALKDGAPLERHPDTDGPVTRGAETAAASRR
ncbi:hypothetical protein [Streptomyces sp. JH34]|uniref:hypothetical protein n=1 Tax=Streptomyces sp. JH34 TaxID=2793633 RepID=UPI0023F88634|nr:hypothetical protein [Streptomyces sp. JH34]MDF6017487.1 hypothetical protein [Streptomyces sp. JH34]